MMNTNDVVASLEVMITDAGVTMYEFLPEDQHRYPKAKQVPLIFILNIEEVMRFFPAGEPVLGHHFLLRTSSSAQEAHLLEVFDLANEVVLAEDISEYHQLNTVDLQGGAAMELNEHQKQMDQYLEELENDQHIQVELDRFAQERADDRKAAIESRLATTGFEQVLADAQAPETVQRDLSAQGRSTGD